MRRVAVTGLGVVSPLGIGIDRHWQALMAARTAIGRSERLAGLGFPIDVAAEIPEQVLGEYVSRFPRKQLKLFSRVTLFGMIGSSLALESAGLQGNAVNPLRFGVFLGTFFTNLPFALFLNWMEGAGLKQQADAFDLSKANAYCMTSINPMDFSLKTMPNLSAGHIAIVHNAQGICRVIADGCTAGLHAVGQAFQAIREDQMDIALCGGAEAPLEEFVFVNFCTLDFLARDGGVPEQACRPFDSERRGAVLGEGAGILVLEEYEHALARGAPIYGEILGFGAAAGRAVAGRESEVDELTEGIGLSMRAGLESAGAERADFISANGDSTRRHDLAEARAVREVFGEPGKRIPVTATKSMHGHLVSGSGPLELISCLLALEKGVIPPTVNLRAPDPLCELNCVAGLPRPLPEMESALVNAVGLFGDSATVVVGKAP